WVYYLTRTGALWNGPIGSARFIVRTPYRPWLVEYPDTFKLTSHVERPRATGRGGDNELIFEVSNWKPTGDFQIFLGGLDPVSPECPRADGDAAAFSSFSSEQLQHCINRTYARHGRPFKDARFGRLFYPPTQPAKVHALSQAGLGRARVMALRFA